VPTSRLPLPPPPLANWNALALSLSLLFLPCYLYMQKRFTAADLAPCWQHQCMYGHKLCSSSYAIWVRPVLDW
jgi:hypothetical protein